MKQRYFRCMCLLTSGLLAGMGICTKAQSPSASETSQPQKVVVAGSQYNRSGFHQWLWGRHYRPEWVTPVTVTTLHLDTAAGGLTPYEAGGGNQSKTLKLRTAEGKEYVLRSIDKSFGKTLPELYKGSFVENLINDQVSIAHPYSSVTIPSMAEAAGIYHTNPVIRYVPRQAALGNFNDEFGNDLYILEQRPDGNWQEAGNFGNAGEIISTQELLAGLLKNNDVSVDQQLFVRSRLFDMFIGDWGRHEDQWRWAIKENNGQKIYQPIPRDRDQAYTKFDGALLKVALSAAGLSHLKSFDGNVKDISTFNFSARNLDRRMTNETGLDTWINTAKELQSALTDDVIEAAVKQLPDEVYPLSGDKIADKLKSRRNNLVQFATDYYGFLAEEVDVPATEQKEYFEIIRLNEKETKVSIYSLNGENTKSAAPYYERTFKNSETKEIRLYGIAGNDNYQVSGDFDNDITVRIIGGKDKDVINDASRRGATTHIYDDADNTITASRNTKIHRSDKDSIHAYKYDDFTYDKKGLKPTIFYSNTDRFYVGLGYEVTKQGWRKEPFASKQGLYARYSISQNAFSFGYQGIFTHAIGGWDLYMNADYDAIRWTNYFGIGNETIELPQPQQNFDYYRVRSREIYAGIGLNKKLGQWSYLRVTPFFQATKVINDKGRFLADNTVGGLTRGTEGQSYSWDNYAGVSLSWLLAQVDNVAVPTKGISFSSTLAHTRSLETDRAINSFNGAFNFYIPLGNQLVFAVRNGGGTITGDPKFYQLNTIGGSMNVRGFRRDRFRARTAFYNSNELQWLLNFKSTIFNGKVGPVAFYDIGRVWQPGEESNIWHHGYGAGLIIAPFNKFAAKVSYGLSQDNKVFHISLNRAF
ncbi:MAG: ShlB/FhaC/HecB family hemolysin secretion/activation protein [Chitinophagaceae bacterium]